MTLNTMHVSAINSKLKSNPVSTASRTSSTPKPSSFSNVSRGGRNPSSNSPYSIEIGSVYSPGYIFSEIQQKLILQASINKSAFLPTDPITLTLFVDNTLSGLKIKKITAKLRKIVKLESS